MITFDLVVSRLSTQLSQLSRRSNMLASLFGVSAAAAADSSSSSRAMSSKKRVVEHDDDDDDDDVQDDDDDNQYQIHQQPSYIRGEDNDDDDDVRSVVTRMQDAAEDVFVRSAAGIVDVILFKLKDEADLDSLHVIATRVKHTQSFNPRAVREEISNPRMHHEITQCLINMLNTMTILHPPLSCGRKRDFRVRVDYVMHARPVVAKLVVSWIQYVALDAPKPTPPICYVCNEMGHEGTLCVARRQSVSSTDHPDSEGDSPIQHEDEQQQQEQQEQDNGEARCYECGGWGHVSRHCPHGKKP